MAKSINNKKSESAEEYYKQMRLRKGLTQEDLSTALGYGSKQIVSNWERGVCSPPLDKLYQLIRLLDLDKKKVMLFFLEQTERIVREKMMMPGGHKGR